MHKEFECYMHFGDWAEAHETLVRKQWARDRYSGYIGHPYVPPSAPSNVALLEAEMLGWEAGSDLQASGEHAGASSDGATGWLFDELMKILPRETPGCLAPPSPVPKLAAESALQEDPCNPEPADEETESELSSEHDVEEGVYPEPLDRTWESYPRWLSSGTDPLSLLARERVTYEWDRVSVTTKEIVETLPLDTEWYAGLDPETRALLHQEGFGAVLPTGPDRGKESEGTEEGTSTSTPWLNTASSGCESATHEEGTGTTTPPSSQTSASPAPPSSHTTQEAALPSPGPAKLSKGQRLRRNRAAREANRFREQIELEVDALMKAMSWRVRCEKMERLMQERIEMMERAVDPGMCPWGRGWWEDWNTWRTPGMDGDGDTGGQNE